MHRNALVVLVSLLAVLCIARNEQWRNDGSLWEDILEKSPNKARAFNEYGIHVLAAGDPERALRLLKRSMQLDPYQPEVYVNLGLAFEKMGRTDDALAAYDRAIFTHPESPTAYYNLGVLYYRTLKDRSRALDYFLKARDLDPLEPDVHNYLASIYAEMGNEDLSRQESSLYDRLKH